MFNGATLFLLSMLYLAALFGIAWYGDRHITRLERYRTHIYSLALAVYCTSWTFYGAVGTAVAQGWSYLPIYLGPILLMILGRPLLERVVAATREQGITSIADFIASRYGKARSLGVIVTVMAVVGTLPYIALQLKAVSMSYEVLTEDSGNLVPGLDTAFYVAAGLALFTILFGVRRADAREHRHGLMLAIAFESLMKLLGFILIGLFALDVIGGVGPLMERMVNHPELRTRFLPDALPQDFWSATLLAFLAIFCLPRQFQVMAVEADNPRQLRAARWLFPAYLMIFSLFVPAIAAAGLMVLQGTNAPPDAYVLALPGELNQQALTLLTFLGGFSAATAMVIVALLALSTMVSNEIVLPLLLKARERRPAQRDFVHSLLPVRAFTIVFIMSAAWFWHRAIDASAALAAIGLLSFAMAAQFAPALVAGVYWRRASRRGVLAGLLAGFVAWLDMLLLPSLDPGAASLIAPLFSLPEQPGIAWGAPLALFLNLAVMVVISLLDTQSLAERLQASAFTGTQPDGPSGRSRKLALTYLDLQELAGRFLGERNARRAMNDFLARAGARRDEPADAEGARFTERLIAGAIGTASARMVMTSLLRGRQPDSDVLLMLDETSQAVRFNRALLEATLDNISQGVSVVDADLRLVGWNKPYEELLDYPDGFLYVGRPVAELIRFNGERGYFDGGDIESHVEKRLAYMRAGSRYRFERHREDGQVLEIRGNPLPMGGFVTTYADITEHKDIERKLQEAKAMLETRVQERTQALRTTMEELHRAKAAAEQANHTKTRFLAAASHDLLQPLNAATLFTSVLAQRAEQAEPEVAELARRVADSLAAAEDILGALLDISRLDAGALRAEKKGFRADELLDALKRQFTALAEERGLGLQVRSCRAVLDTDRQLLRRVLQNFLVNALRYTPRGGRVLLGCRRRKGGIEIGVWDTGPGIAAEHRETIFQEFRRLDTGDTLRERGLGLGLAIADRIARMLDHPLSLESTPGRGSKFSILVPVSDQPLLSSPGRKIDQSRLQGLQVWCVDNEESILAGMERLLDCWGCQVRCFASADAFRAGLRSHDEPEIILADHHLGGVTNGLDLLRAARARFGAIPGIVITADRDDALAAEVREEGFALLSKPVKPAAMRALMLAVLERAYESA